MQDFEFHLEDNLFTLHRQLKSKKYQHQEYVSFYVRDPKLRHIHKASVRDRVVHQGLFRKLYLVFDKRFIFDSYSCRLQKGTHRGVFRLEEFVRKSSKNYKYPIYALQCDIKKFFASVNHDILLNLIRRLVADKNTLWLINEIINSFDRGLPLGNVTSQLFANIYLNELDQFIKHKLKEKYYIRYCDDFVILGPSKEYSINLICPIRNFLREELKLSFHLDKIKIRKPGQGIDFLGYITLPHYRVLRTKTKKRMFRLINDKNIDSYLGILKHCRGHKLQQQIDILCKKDKIE